MVSEKLILYWSFEEEAGVTQGKILRKNVREYLFTDLVMRLQVKKNIY